MPSREIGDQIGGVIDLAIQVAHRVENSPRRDSFQSIKYQERTGMLLAKLDREIAELLGAPWWQVKACEWRVRLW